MYQNVSSRPFSSEIRVSFQVTPCEILRWIQSKHHCTTVLYSNLATCCSYQKENGRNLETIRKELLYLQLVSVGVEKYFHIFTLLSVSG